MAGEVERTRAIDEGWSQSRPGTQSPGDARRAALRAARREDLAAIERLLAEGGLPSDGVAEHLEAYLVAEAAGEVVGTVGMERYGPDALFRSLAVATGRRGRGVARALMARLVEGARGAGVERAWAFTLTIPDLLQRWGFRPAPREAAPAAIRGTTEFTGCCASAPFFVLDLAGSAVEPARAAAPGVSGGPEAHRLRPGPAGVA